MKERAEIIKRLESMEQLLAAMAESGKTDTPRLSRNEAKKFLVIGEEKLRILEMKGLIKKRVDLFGQAYYMRDELIELLKKGMIDPAMKSNLRRAV